VFTARYVLHSTFCPRSVFMCFMWIWEQTAIISLYSIDWLVGFYNTDWVCLLRGTFCILRSAHTVYLWFVWIWETTAMISLYSIDWLVFITETECIYCSVRSTFYVLPTQCVYVFCVDLRKNSDYFTIQHWLTCFYNRDGMFTARYVLHSTFCPNSVFMGFVWNWEQRAIISLYSIDWLVFITEAECVYCAVRSTLYVLPTQLIYVFCVDLRTNSNYFTVEHWLTGWFL